MILPILIAFTLVARAVLALGSIEVKGNAMYVSGTDDRFYIRGLDYQPGGSSNFTDPLADVTGCKRDVPVFKELGLNTIRVYSVDNSADHSGCMKLLEQAGIYLVLDVNTPKNSIDRSNPYVSYNTAYLQHIFATIDAFSGYDNVLGFFAANEVINNENTTGTAPVIKAVVRDMKEYISKHANRTIPVGYSAADISINRLQQAQYFNCGPDQERIDMLGINDYSWCGASSFQLSGYSAKVQEYSNYTRPIFFSEFGCNKVTPRLFTEVQSIYSTQMSPVFSGGLVYEYSEEENHYGLVTIDSNTQVTPNTDFNNLKTQLSEAESPSGSGGATDEETASDCPAFELNVWEGNGTIPALPSRASALMESGAGKPLGTDGPSTQNGDSGDEQNSSSSSSPTSTASVSSDVSSDVSSTSAAASSSSGGAAIGITVPKIFSSSAIFPGVLVISSLIFGYMRV